MSAKAFMPIEDDLPPGWAWATIGDVVQYVSRGRAPKYVQADGVPVINQRCVRWNGLNERFLKWTAAEEAERRAADQFLRTGDVLWNSTGTGTIGRATIFKGLSISERAVVDSHVTIVRPAGYQPELLHYWIMSAAVQDKLEDMQTGSTNQVELPRGVILETPLPVPPANEQRRIVEKIDELFSQVEAGEQAVERAQKLLERYRQSVLNAAVTGELTREWRERHKGELESGEALLKRILQARREAWEKAELAKMRARGKPPTDDRWKQRYKEPCPLDVTNLPELPEGWVWVNIGLVAPLQPGYAFSSKGFRQFGRPLLKGSNVRDGWINREEIDFWRDDPTLAQYELSAGDIVLAMDRPVYSSGSRATKVAMLDDRWQGGYLLQRLDGFDAVAKSIRLTSTLYCDLIRSASI
jgi:type I restriction enzyme S subunit